jgi:hypothetical protein
MKLYVGAWSNGDGGVFVASGSGRAEFAPYPLRCNGTVGDVRRVAFAVLVDHLGEDGHALRLCGSFERALGPRLRGNFWTLRESEVAEVIALIESGDRVS